MSDMISSCRFAARRLTQLRYKTGLLALAIVSAAQVDVGARDSKDWIVLKNCRLISNPANDGDSFHASAGAREYIFRLYMVDAPETDEMNPARLVEQAKYFAITVPQAIEVGLAAKEFTRAKLSEPFTVFTRMSDAMGRSKLERFYAFVQTKDGDLGEELVRNGLARNYGFKAVPPGLRNSRLEVEKLQQFEDEAQQEKIGGWGVDAGRLNVHAQKPAPLSVFVAEEIARFQASPLNSFSRNSAPPAFRSSSTAVDPVDVKKSHAKEKIEPGRIDINTATEKELKMIPGVGPVMASRIIAARPFRSANDLKKVSGIGDKKYAKIRPYFQ
ncbi:MAG TPA: helix-hairpin-helix domain-containing protein [Candidatus Dormibacteraeota bacterium]|nr:helix-hairpin-helix domain-containing protein [Candidatus Dormibacteraeota bacterium]